MKFTSSELSRLWENVQGPKDDPALAVTQGEVRRLVELAMLQSGVVAKPNEYVCAACGHEQDAMDKPCFRCGSVRVILISIAKQLFGNNYRDAFKHG